MSATALTPLQLEEIRNLAAESQLDPETALTRALELHTLRRLLEACRRRHPYAALQELPGRGLEQAFYRERIRASLKAAPADDGLLEPDLLTIANRE